MTTQCHLGLEDALNDPHEDAEKSIPDILFEFPTTKGMSDSLAPCIVVEAKVTVLWDLGQAWRHKRFVQRHLDFFWAWR